MIKYTSAAFTLLLNDFKKLIKGFKIALSLFTLLYLTFAIVAKMGIFPINVALLVMYCLYTAFLLFFKKKASNDDTNTVKHTYHIAKLVLKAIPLATTLYTLWITSNNLNGLTIIVTTLLLIFWILQVLLEIVVLVVESYAKLFKSAFLIDAKPFINAYNLFNVKENDIVIDFDEHCKNVGKLDPIIKANKAAKAAKKKQKAVNTIKAFIPPVLLSQPKTKKVKVKKVKKVKNSSKKSD